MSLARHLFSLSTRSLATATVATAMAASSVSSASSASSAGSGWFSQQAADITGAPFDFARLAGRVTLVTNVASR